MSFLFRLLACCGAAAVLLTSTTLSAQCRAKTVCSCNCDLHGARSYTQGRWFVLESENFRIRCEGNAEPAKHLARHAETLRKTLATKWLGEEPTENWSPKCEILLYANQARYVAAVGRGSEQTSGSSLVDVRQGRIVGRRIDLVGAGAEFLSAALPHELTHVVLKDRFPTSSWPRWADEGIAMLADPTLKQRRHHSDLQSGLAARKTFSAATLLTMNDYPAADRWGVFYGQSRSMTKFLVDRKSPEAFVRFVAAGESEGYDRALQASYGIANVSELDRLWRSHLASTTARPRIKLASTAAHTR